MDAEVNHRMSAIEASGVFRVISCRRQEAPASTGALFPESVSGTNRGYLAAAIVSEELANHALCGGLT
jgi:hypothetical protein